GVGPMSLAPPLAKAANNATGASIPGVRAPYTDPAAMLNAMMGAAKAPSEIELARQQAALAGLNTQAAAQKIKFLGQLSALMGGADTSSSPTATPSSTTPNAPSGGSFTGGVPSDNTVSSATAPMVGGGQAKTPEALSSALATPAAEGTGNPGYVPYAHSNGTAYLHDLANASAASALGPGYTVKMTSGERPGSRVAGTGGVSQHALGNASDFQIVAPDGTAIPNKGNDTTGAYGKLAIEMRNRVDPRLAPFLAWGGNFTTGPQNGPRDLMHFDLGGDRGRYGTLAAEASAGAPIQLAQA